MDNNTIQKKIYEAANKIKKERVNVLTQAYLDGMEDLRECIRKNVKDGWGLLPFFTPAEYCFPANEDKVEKDNYFIELIDTFDMQSIFEDLKEFFGPGWSETFDECVKHIKSGNFKSIIPFLISALEKVINSVINKDQNFFGKALKREYQYFVDQLDEHVYIKEFAIETKKVIEEYVFRNGVKEHSEIPLFNRNLIQHGNDTPDRWGKAELYKIISLIGGLIHLAKIVRFSRAYDS